MAPGIYYSPTTIAELVDVLRTKKDNNCLYFVAGATDLLLNMRKLGRIDYSVIDISQLDDIKGILETNDSIEIGAAVTMDILEKSKLIRHHGNALAEAASKVGSTQIRNRATIGGNIANASQCADTITAGCALGAKVLLLNSEGKIREKTLDDFVLDIGLTQIQQDEMIYKVSIPKSEKTMFSSFSKVGSRKSVATSKINHAVQATIADNCVCGIKIYFGSIGPKTVRVVSLEEKCVGKLWDNELLEKLSFWGTQIIDEIIPTRASRSYKRIAVKGVISDVFLAIKYQKEVGHR